MHAVETVSCVRQVMVYTKVDRSRSGIRFSQFIITHRPLTQRLPGDKTAWSRGSTTIHPPPYSATIRKTRNFTNVQSFPHDVVRTIVKKKLYFHHLKVFQVGWGMRYTENYLKFQLLTRLKVIYYKKFRQSVPYHQTLNIWVFVIVTKCVFFFGERTRILNVIYVKFEFLGHSMTLAVSRRPLTAENVVPPRNLWSTKWHWDTLPEFLKSVSYQ